MMDRGGFRPRMRWRRISSGQMPQLQSRISARPAAIFPSMALRRRAACMLPACDLQRQSSAQRAPHGREPSAGVCKLEAIAFGDSRCTIVGATDECANI